MLTANGDWLSEVNDACACSSNCMLRQISQVSNVIWRKEEVLSWSWFRCLSETVRSQEVKTRSHKWEISFAEKLFNTFISRKRKERGQKTNLNIPIKIFIIRWHESYSLENFAIYVIIFRSRNKKEKKNAK